MSKPAVNGVITDSVTQVNTKVLGDAPAIAMDTLFMTTSQALANAALNATNNQQQAYLVGQTAAAIAISTMLRVDAEVIHPLAKTAPNGTEAPQPAAPQPAAAPAPAAPAAPTEPATALAATRPVSALSDDLAMAAHHAVRASSDPMLMLMVLDAGALAIFDAVAHLNRVSMIAEAASTLALTEALAKPGSDDWQKALAAAEQSIDRATSHLDNVARIAISLTRQARLAGPADPQGLAVANDQTPGLKIEPNAPPAGGGGETGVGQPV